MSDVKMVVRIPEEIYERFAHEYSEESLISDYVEEVILDAFTKGTIIPKGNGKIVDIDKVHEEMKATKTYDIGFALERVKPIIEADKENGLVEIGSLAPGTTVEFGGTKWVVLDKCYPTKYISQSQGVFCIAEKITFRKTFDENKCSNWAESSLRKYLNGEFKANLTVGIGEDVLLPFERDLTSNDGLKDYGTCIDTISVLSRDEYENYRQYICNKHACWWTLTARSAQNSDRSCCALRVYGGGSLGSGGAVIDGGVVPVVCVRPSFKVKDIEER